jgi:hypothetical protein
MHRGVTGVDDPRQLAAAPPQVEGELSFERSCHSGDGSQLQARGIPALDPGHRHLRYAGSLADLALP